MTLKFRNQTCSSLDAIQIKKDIEHFKPDCNHVTTKVIDTLVKDLIRFFGHGTHRILTLKENCIERSVVLHFMCSLHGSK